MKHLRERWRADREKKQRYFCEAGAEITARNLILLRTMSLVTIFLLLFFYAITPLIIPSWKITLQHLLFLPAALILHLVSTLYQKKGSGGARTVELLCLLFETVLFAFVILIDVTPYPNAPSSFMPLLCVVLPILFILPLLHTYLLVLFFEAVYVVAVLVLKDSFIGQHDIFASVVGLAFSVPVALVILRLRVQDHELRQEYKRLSIQDTLSAGILNKKASEEAAICYLSAGNPKTTCTLMILDVDDFKAINDQLGHYDGDQILRAAGELLAEVFRSSDIIGRFGGDEFLILVKGTADYATLAEKCRVVQERFPRVSAEHDDLPVTCSIGAVMVEGQDADFQSLFRQADDALYEAKGAGKNCFVLRRYQVQ